jgi:NSS family neurotransmitter:Na+ symporter
MNEETPAASTGQRSPEREFWSSRIGFIFATMGSAVGLGSIWKFPYEVGANGGSVFIIFYLLGLAIVVLPLLLLEFAIGRRGRADASTSLREVARAAGATPAWAAVGLLGIVTSVLILSFYSVIGGWALAYLVETLHGGLPAAAPEPAQARFDALMASPLRMIAYHSLFLVVTAFIVARGIVHGIERACAILMPAMILLIVALAAYSVIEGDSAAALRFLFHFDWSQATPRVALEALGLGFFSIGVGLAVMITYAAHAGPEIHLRQIAVVSVAADTAISFLSGLAIFPIVFAHGLSPSSGPGLMFVSLPLAFANVPFGVWAAAAFFLLLALAAIASAISLLEMPVALLERRFGMRRPLAVPVAAATCWALGLSSVFSFNIWAGWFPLAQLPFFATATAFDLTDHLTSNLMLPLGGLALSLFGGWALPERMIAEELRLSPPMARLLRWILRYAAPLVIAAVALAPAFL